MCTSVSTVLTAPHEGSPRSNSGVTQSTAGPTVSTDIYRNFSPKELTSYVSFVKPWWHYLPLLWLSVWCRKCLVRLWLLMETGWLAMMLLLIRPLHICWRPSKMLLFSLFYFLDRPMIKGGRFYVLPPVIFTDWPHSVKKRQFSIDFHSYRLSHNT